jgi:hypothetical protein
LYRISDDDSCALGLHFIMDWLRVLQGNVKDAWREIAERNPFLSQPKRRHSDRCSLKPMQGKETVRRCGCVCRGGATLWLGLPQAKGLPPKKKKSKKKKIYI